jgi:hypothetical protein
MKRTLIEEYFTFQFNLINCEIALKNKMHNVALLYSSVMLRALKNHGGFLTEGDGNLA